MDLSAAASLRSITSAKFRVSVAAAAIRACAVLGSWSSRPLRASAGSAAGSAPTPAYSARNFFTSSMPVSPASCVTRLAAGAGSSAVALGPVSTSALAGLGLTSAVGGAVSVLGLLARALLVVAASLIGRDGAEEVVAPGVGAAGGLSRMITASGALGVWVRTVVFGVVEVVGAVSWGGSARAFFARSALTVSAAEARLPRPSPAAETEEVAGRTGTAGMTPAAPRVRASLQETNRKDYIEEN